MKPVSGKRLSQVLRARGWSVARIEGSHHVHTHPDFTQRITVPVHASRDLPTGTQHRIMRQAGLTDADL